MVTTLKRRTVYILAFIIPVVSMALSLIICRVYPFGEAGFSMGDMLREQIPFLLEFRRKLKAGESLAYSWNLGIGDDFALIYAYYLASPENWLFALCPASWAEGFLGFWVIVKMGLGGMTMAHFLIARSETYDSRAVMFSAFYGLSGFVCAYYFSGMNLNAVWLAPLMLLGIEQLVQRGRWKLYLIALAACILTNFYLAIPVCIFCVLYFIVQLIIYSHNRSASVIKTIRRFVGISALALMLSAVIWLPVIFALHGSGTVVPDYSTGLTQYFSPLFGYSKHCIGTTSVFNSWKDRPSLYCGSLVFLLLPLYLTHPRIHVRKKICNTALLTIFWVSFTFNIPAYLWRGFGNPEYWPALESFLYIFLVVSMCHEVALAGRTSPRGLLYGLPMAILWTAAIMYAGNGNYWVELLSVIVTLVFIALYVIIYLVCSHRFMKIGSALVVLLAFTEITVNTVSNIGANMGSANSSGFIMQAQDYLGTIGAAVENTAFSRAYDAMEESYNSGLFGGFSTTNLSSRTMNARVPALYEHMGLAHTDRKYGQTQITPIEGAILGRRYTYCNSEYNVLRGPLYDTVEIESVYHLCRNNDVLPFGWALPIELAENLSSSITDGDTEAELRSLAVSQAISQALTGKPLFRLLPAELQERPLGDNRQINVTLNDSGYYYVVFTRLMIGTVNCTADDVMWRLPEGYKGVLMNLGYHEDGTGLTFKHNDILGLDMDVKVSNADDNSSPVENDNNFFDIDLYELDMDVYEQCLEILSKNPLNTENTDPRRVSGNITCDAESLLVLPIANSANWEVRVDGKRIAQSEWAGCFIEIPLSIGTHTVSLTYRIRGLGIGLVISFLAIAITVLLWLWEKRRGAAVRGLRTHEPFIFASKRDVIAALVVSLGLVFTLCVFSPLDLFIHNSVNYQIGLRSELIGIIPGALIAWIIIAIILCLPIWSKRARDIVLSLILGMTLAMYTQVLFMNSGMVLFTGDPVDYADITVWHIVNLVIFIAVALLPLCGYGLACRFKKEQYCTMPAIAVAGILCAMQAAGLISAGATNEIAEGFEENPQYLSYAPVLEAGEQQNVTVFIFDRLDIRFMQEALEKHPELSQWLDGFTLYENNISEYTSTFPSVTTLLTGMNYTHDLDWQAYWKQAWSAHSFIDVLRDNGYSSNLLLDRSSTFSDFGELRGLADNAKRCDDISINYGQIFKSNLSLSLLRVMPYLAKSFAGDIDTGFANRFFSYDMPADGQPPAIDASTDMNFFKYVWNHEVELGESKRTFNFIHLNGAHGGGYSYDEATDSIVLSGDYSDSVYACFAMLHRYIEELKALGVYDRTAIVVMGDHGHLCNIVSRDKRKQLNEATVTALLVKPDKASGELQIDAKSELSHKYFGASVLELAGLTHEEFGPSYWDIMQMDDAPPRFFDVNIWHGNSIEHACTYSVTGDANDFNNWEYLP